MATELLRDRLMARLAEMGDSPDYARLAADVLAIRNAPEPLARRLVMQALVIEDRQEHWQRIGAAACASAPDAPGVYLFLDASRQVLYVGKALRIRRRLRAHFAARRWRQLGVDMARVATVEWHVVGSELEALLIEAQWIARLSPRANVQRGIDQTDQTRTARDVVVLLPSASVEHAVVVAARPTGDVLMRETSRDAIDAQVVAEALKRFYTERTADGTHDAGGQLARAAIVHRWLKQRGGHATRFDPRDFATVRDWEAALMHALTADELFRERLVFR